MTNAILLTREGLEKLQEEYEYLVTTKRKEVSETLKEALSYGDLSENAEYTLALQMQNDLEYKIAELLDKLSKVRLVEINTNNIETVQIGLTVKVLDDLNTVVDYTIVGNGESDIDNNKISIKSPVGSSLLGGKRNEIIEIETPDGMVNYKILDIYYKAQ